MRPPAVWLVDDERAVGPLIALDTRLDLLPETDRLRIVGEADREAGRWWQAGRVALRLAIGARLGPDAARAPFQLASRGKPGLPGIEFSISHTPGATLIAVGEGGALGVDIERVRPVSIAPARRAAIEAAAEAAGKRALPEGGACRFMAAWCRLEALAKESGLGIGATLSQWGAWRGDRGGAWRGDRDGRPAGGTRPDSNAVRIDVRDLAVGAGFAAAIASLWLPAEVEIARVPLTEDAIERAMAGRLVARV